MPDLKLEAASACPLPLNGTESKYKPPPGRSGNLTIIQQHTLTKFKRELVEKSIFVEGRMDDTLLLRFLRARKFDITKAIEMLKAAEEWRKSYEVDSIIEDFHFEEKVVVDKYYPQFYHKVDKDGRPIYIERLGKLDIKALYAATTQDRILRRLVLEYERFIIERLPACSRAAGHPVETSCTILDLQNVSLSNFYRVREYVMQATSIGQDRYPECMGKFYIINAPFMFSAVWSAIKPWLDEVTISKIDILGSNYKTTLLRQIPAENLPQELGGSCTCPGGCSLSDAGPWKDVTDNGESKAV